MTPEELAQLAAESAKYESLTNNLGIVNIISVLLAAGITIATFYYGNKLSEVKEKIANQKIAEANAKAAIANQNAESAKAESASANVVATEAKNKQAELAIKLNESNIRRDKAEYELNKKIEEDREKEKPRMLSDKQKEELLSLLQLSAEPTIKTDLIAEAGDEEAFAFSKEITSVLKQANWPTNNGDAVTTSNKVGVFVIFHSKEKAPDRAIYLLGALTKIGLKIQPLYDSRMPLDAVSILIGHKRTKG
ncbi:hypothetical protein [Spirosoma litoris]